MPIFHLRIVAFSIVDLDGTGRINFLNNVRTFPLGKLLSKWEGPYVIEEVYRSDAIKINNFEGTNPKVVMVKGSNIIS